MSERVVPMLGPDEVCGPGQHVPRAQATHLARSCTHLQESQPAAQHAAPSIPTIPTLVGQLREKVQSQAGPAFLAPGRCSDPGDLRKRASDEPPEPQRS